MPRLTTADVQAQQARVEDILASLQSHFNRLEAMLAIVDAHVAATAAEMRQTLEEILDRLPPS